MAAIRCSSCLPSLLLATTLAACGGGKTATPSVDAPASSPTGWPLEVLSWDLTRAYPGLRYEWRLGVKGGAYPYTFSLDAAPSGMSIDARTGVLSWQAPSSPSSGAAVAVRIVDGAGASLVHRFAIDVTTSGFSFVDGAAGADANPGTLAAPWKTIAHALASAGGGIVYVRAGTYDATGFGLEGTKPTKWLAYPGERPILDLGGGIAGVHASECVVSGFELRHAGAKMFWVGGQVSDLVWRNNVMHGVSSVGTNNPAFVFFEDAAEYRPIEGRVQYDRIVVQQNTFYDLTNDVDHGASLIAYNVKNLLFEDNEAYGIDGRGVNDKDDGYQNTFRHNVLHGMGIGVALASQYTQGQIEVCYNLVHDCATAVEIGSQPGYIRDVFVHHNTLVGGGIGFGEVTDGAESTDLNVFDNIIENVADLPYALYPVAAPGGYRYPSWVGDPSRARIDHNLVWTSGSYVAGYGWGLANKTLSDWRAAGYDRTGVRADPGLGADFSLPADSPYLGEFGRDLKTPASPARSP